MNAPAAPLAIAVPASKAGLATANDALLRHLDAHGVSAGAAGRAALVLEEALMNVAMHGGQASAPGWALTVELSVQVGADTVTLELRDDGRPFDPRSLPAPQRPASIELAEPGGLGVHLMRRFARSLEYRREDGRNVLTLAIAR